MKRAFLITMAAVLLLTIVGCGKPQDSENPAGSNSSISQTTKNEQPGTNDQNPVQQVFHPATSAATGAYATIQVSADIKLDDDTAWLGLCPADKDYVTEQEADEVDVVWYYADIRENETDPYVFACDFSEVEDGTYALVITSSDDENVGYVVIQLEMTKKGESLTFNYDNAKIKDRPNR